MSRFTTLKTVCVLRETPKSWQVRLLTGDAPFIPKSQFFGLPQLAIGDVKDIQVSTWLVEKWKANGGVAGTEDPPTFEFDLECGVEMVVQAIIPDAQSQPDDGFLFDYSKKQLLATCMAYRSTLQQMTALLEKYSPELANRLARDDNLLDGRACSPDSKGMFPMVTQTWRNQDALRDIGKQGAAVLQAEHIGQAMLEKMGAIETLLKVKRADVAAELLRSMDEDDE